MPRLLLVSRWAITGSFESNTFIIIIAFIYTQWKVTAELMWSCVANTKITNILRLTNETKLFGGLITEFVFPKQTNSRLQVSIDIIIHNFMLCIGEDGNSTFHSAAWSAFACTEICFINFKATNLHMCHK